MRLWISSFVNLLYSEKCALCGDFLSPREGSLYPICSDCEAKLPARTDQLCGKCSTDLISERKSCLRCRERDYSFESNHSLFLYGGLIKELLTQYKSKNSKLLSRFFAKLMEPVIRGSYPDFEIVPVPFRRSSKRSRGWDQVEEICIQLKRLYGLPYRRALKRRGTSAQKTLNYDGRQANLAGNISIRRYTYVPQKVLLIDDVFTTGATANACAETLKEIGVVEVRMLSIAIDQ